MPCRKFSAKPLSEPNTGLLVIGPLGTNFSEIWIKIQRFPHKKLNLKMSLSKLRQSVQAAPNCYAQTFVWIKWDEFMMTSSNGNIFRVTGPLCGEFTGPGEFLAQRPVTRSFDVSLICARINDWANNREAGDLRRHRGHYDVNVMFNNLPVEFIWWINIRTYSLYHL